MILAAMGMCLATMVGPLDETPVVRISRPGGGGPEFVRTLVAGNRESGGGVVVPNSAVGGGGEASVVGATAAEVVEGGSYVEESQGLYTEQLMRAFGYDRSHYGYTVIDYPGWGGGRRWGGGGGHGHHRPERPVVDPRVISSLRDLVPIEARFPPVPGR